MNQKQFDAIARRFFPRVDPRVIAACSDNLQGLPAADAERKHGLGKATVGRYSAKILKWYDFIQEVSDYGRW